jgi:hypothetical protein
LLNKHRHDDFVFAKLQDANKVQVASGLLQLFEKEPVEEVQSSILYAIDGLACFLCDTNPQGWPDLLPTALRLASGQGGQGVASVKNALKLLKELVPTLKSEFVRLTAEVGQVLQANLANPQLPIKTQASLLVCEMVETLDKKDWAPLTATIPVIIQVCEALAASNQTSELDEILQAFVSVTGTEADFFKHSMTSAFQPATLFANIVKSKAADTNLRNMSQEWITTYAEKKPKFLAKNVPSFVQTSLESCMALMLEIEDGDAALKEWAERMDDEEGEEDADEMFSTGEESIDRIVQAFTMDSCASQLLGLIQAFSQQPAWQAKHAALAAIKQVVEYVEDQQHMDGMATLLLAHVGHQHPRVRYTALHAIGQFANDQAPQFQEQHHAKVMPLLMTAMDDPVDRVSAMAMSAFVSFAEEMKDLLHQYAHPFMEKFLTKLQASKHRGIQEESITAMAVIAGVLGQDFKQYYDRTMPLLKQLIISCTGEKQQRLRGKAFECLSLLGMAVGKEQFLPDAKQAIEAMLQTQEVDEVQGEYIKEAVERISHCLKKDFAPFLPAVLPRLFKSLKPEEEGQGLVRTKADENDDEYEMHVQGKLVKVKSSKFEEMHQAVCMLNTFMSNMEETFFDFVQPTAEALLPLIQMDGEAATFFEDARGEAYETWALLIKSATKGAEARNMPKPSPLVAQLLKTVVTTCVQLLKTTNAEDEPDCEELLNYAWGIQKGLEEAGPGYIDTAEANQLTELLLQLMDSSCQRAAKTQTKVKSKNAAAPAELQGDEDDDDFDPVEDEKSLRKTYSGVLGALMKANPDAMAAHLNMFSQRMQMWFTSKDDYCVALQFCCDLLEHLKEKCCPIWPIFMSKIFESLTHKEDDIRIAAAYAVNLASAIPQFAEAAPQAFKGVAQVVAGKAAKKREESAKCAMDNAVAALFALARNMPQQCPPDINAMGLVLSKLPLKADLEEAKKVHKLLVQLLQQELAGLIGASQENLGKILSIMAEIHKQDDCSDEEIDAMILTVFKAIPAAVLQQNAGAFTEKQQKRIEKMLTSGS